MTLLNSKDIVANSPMKAEQRGQRARAVEGEVRPEPCDGVFQRIQDALTHGPSADAVRFFLQSVEEGRVLCDGGGEVRAAAGTAISNSLLNGLLVACADFPCPYCTNGFNRCDKCAGVGKIEQEFACAHCFTLGLTPCEFCVGSGRAGYAFFPEPIQFRVASIRVEHAVGQIRSGLRAVVDSQHEPEPRHLLSRYIGFQRNHAILQNAMDWLQEHDRFDRALRAKLAARCWRALASSELALAQLLNRHCDLSRSQHADHEIDQNFITDRVDALEREAARLNRAACERLTQLQSHPR